MGQPVGAEQLDPDLAGRPVEDWAAARPGAGSATTRDLNLIYYGSGNPGTWNPSQRPGDNKWSMTIFARDANTGVARWVYQMTPHDEWDYDGVNEMILVDNLTIRGQRANKALVHFDRNGFGYTLDRENGRAAGRREVRPGGELGDAMWTWRPAGRRWCASSRPGRAARTRTSRTSARRRSAPRTSSRRPSRRAPACSTCRPTTSAWTTSRSASPTRPASPSSARPCRCTRRRATSTSATSSPGTPGTGKIVWSKPERFSVWSGALATAGDIVFYGTLEGYLKAVDKRDGQGALQLPHAVRDHRQHQHLLAPRQAVHRGAVRRRRLGRHRHGGRPGGRHRRAWARSAPTRRSPTTRSSAAC